MFYNGESLRSGFLGKLQDIGRPSALDNQPELTEDGKMLWEAYCFVGDHALVELDLYDRRIGLPEDWEFREVVLLVMAMQSETRNLRKSTKDD